MTAKVLVECAKCKGTMESGKDAWNMQALRVGGKVTYVFTHRDKDKCNGNR